MQSKGLTFKARILLIFILVAIIAYPAFLCVDILRFPEMYSPRLRYNLKCDLKAGNELAIEYYQTKYIANNIQLFD